MRGILWYNQYTQLHKGGKRFLCRENGAGMLEITKEMIDEAVESEKTLRKKSEKATVKAACILFVILILEFFWLVGLLNVGILKALTAAAFFVIADILYFFTAVEVIMHMQTKSPYPAVISFYNAYRRRRFEARLNAAPTVEEKLRLFEEYPRRYFGAAGRLSSATEHMNFLMKMCVDRNADELYEQIAKAKPKKILLKFTRLEGMFTYFMLKEDAERYICAFEENADTISKNWDYSLFAKSYVMMYFLEYLNFKQDFPKALEYYDMFMYFQEKAAEVDVSLAFPEEALTAVPIGYAILYCRLGSTEEAEKYYREAEEKLADCDMPCIKKQMEKARGLLEKTKINKLKESGTND